MSDERKDGMFMNLTDLDLEKVAASYPEEMREPFKWFGWYAREICHRDSNILVARLKELQIDHDKTTWSKILRGRWDKDAEGKETTPCLALSKFLKVVKSLREDQRIRDMGGQLPFVETSTTQLIWKFIDECRIPERVNRFGIIVGYTGSQSTATMKEYQRENNHGLCTWQEAPYNGSMKQFVVTLSAKYGGGYHDSMDKAMSRIFRTVTSRNTIMVDNAQTLYKPKMGPDQPVFNFMRGLQDERGCTVIWKITLDFFEKFTSKLAQGYFEQFEGRAGGRRNFLRLPEYPPEEDVLEFAHAFKLKDAEKHIDYLMKIAREPGRIRILLGDLQAAKMVAENEEKQLTIAHVKGVRDEE
jgi:DNA transposition AAA+ family ATPase